MTNSAVPLDELMQPCDGILPHIDGKLGRTPDNGLQNVLHIPPHKLRIPLRKLGKSLWLAHCRGPYNLLPIDK